MALLAEEVVPQLVSYDEETIGESEPYPTVLSDNLRAQSDQTRLIFETTRKDQLCSRTCCLTIAVTSLAIADTFEPLLAPLKLTTNLAKRTTVTYTTILARPPTSLTN